MPARRWNRPPSRPAEPHVEASLTETDDKLTITVADNGPGLPPRAREHLFAAFEGSAKAGGTGLGLPIARELAEAHGGQLSLCRDPGRHPLRPHPPRIDAAALTAVCRRDFSLRARLQCKSAQCMGHAVPPDHPADRRP